MGMEELNSPQGVTAVNRTGSICIADQCIDCVKVFDSTGKYLFKFGGEGKINWPIGVAICGDRILFTQGSYNFLNYQLNAKFISRIGRQGSGELEFHNLFSLTIDQ